MGVMIKDSPRDINENVQFFNLVQDELWAVFCE